jgi:hypothetical protein
MIQKLGTSETVGDLLDKLNEIPFNADFGFRNQPVQTLYYDSIKVSCYFDSDENDVMEMTPDFDLFQKVHGFWSDETFGARSPLGPLHHLAKEVQEVINTPGDIEEYADCGLLLMDALRLSGFTMYDLYIAMTDKYRKNKLRKWGKPDENGTFEHIRE